MIDPKVQTMRRSQRVMLQLEVLMRVELPGCSSGQVQPFTSVVSAHGGLLEAPVRVNLNQKITLVNPNTGESVNCRVVRVDLDVIDAQVFAIAFEFDQRSPLFWPIAFPPEDCKEQHLPTDP